MMGTIKSSLNDIENESKLINELVLSAKEGYFNRVWEIIGEPNNTKKAHLLNYIPETRRWGVLHQAVFWNNKDILKKLLEYDACDVEIRAKRCTSECGVTTRMRALEIAESYGYPDMASILSSHKNNMMGQKLHTFQTKLYLGLVNNTLAAYKTTFHPDVISPSTSVVEILLDIWNDLSVNWERFAAVKEQVCDSMYVVSCEIAKMLEETTTEDAFYEFVIKGYTIEENYVYNYISMAMRRQRSTNYQPTGEDLALGPYIVMYQMLLLFWDKLKAESGTTYRQMTMTKEDKDMYKEGSVFYWQSIVSSTIDQTCARHFPTVESVTGENIVLFIIDNSATCKWQPKNIERYAWSTEMERTYPAGAKFRVMSSPELLDGHYQVKLSLLPY